jgi:hypothetical protein
MKYKFLLPIVFIIILSACSSSHKTTQTPDDVYFSPEKIEDIAQVNSYQEQPSTSNYFDNNYISHKVRNRNRWQSIDDYTYWNDTRYSHPYNWNSYNNSGYNGWNSYNSSWGSCYNGYNNYYYGYSNPYLNPYMNWGYYNGGYGGWNNPYQYNTPIHTSTILRTMPSTNTLTYTNTKYNNTNYYNNPQTGTTQGVNTANNTKYRTQRSSSTGETYSNPTRSFNNNGTAPSSSAGGNSGGFNSKGSSSSKPRG